MSHLVDTNVLSEPTQKAPEGKVLAWLRAHAGQYYVSSITVGEIIYGIERLPHGPKRRSLESWLQTTMSRRGADGIHRGGPVWQRDFRRAFPARETSDWAAQTGQGFLQTDGEKALEGFRRAPSRLRMLSAQRDRGTVASWKANLNPWRFGAFARPRLGVATCLGGKTDAKSLDGCPEGLHQYLRNPGTAAQSSAGRHCKYNRIPNPSVPFTSSLFPTGRLRRGAHP